jgi:hypothetical protein
LAHIPKNLVHALVKKSDAEVSVAIVADAPLTSDPVRTPICYYLSHITKKTIREILSVYWR